MKRRRQNNASPSFRRRWRSILRKILTAAEIKNSTKPSPNRGNLNKGGSLMQQRIKVVLLAMVLLAVLVNCATLGINVKPYGEMSPKEKMAFLFASYNKQYEDYK